MNALYTELIIGLPLEQIFLEEPNDDYRLSMDDLLRRMSAVTTRTDVQIDVDADLRALVLSTKTFAAVMRRYVQLYKVSEEDVQMMELLLSPFNQEKTNRLQLAFCALPLEYITLLARRHFVTTELLSERNPFGEIDENDVSDATLDIMEFESMASHQIRELLPASH